MSWIKAENGSLKEKYGDHKTDYIDNKPPNFQLFLSYSNSLGVCGPLFDLQN